MPDVLQLRCLSLPVFVFVWLHGCLRCLAVAVRPHCCLAMSSQAAPVICSAACLAVLSGSLHATGPWPAVAWQANLTPCFVHAQRTGADQPGPAVQYIQDFDVWLKSFGGFESTWFLALIMVPELGAPVNSRTPRPKPLQSGRCHRRLWACWH